MAQTAQVDFVGDVAAERNHGLAVRGPGNKGDFACNPIHNGIQPIHVYVGGVAILGDGQQQQTQHRSHGYGQDCRELVTLGGVALPHRLGHYQQDDAKQQNQDGQDSGDSVRHHQAGEQRNQRQGNGRGNIPAAQNGPYRQQRNKPAKQQQGKRQEFGGDPIHPFGDGHTVGPMVEAYNLVKKGYYGFPGSGNQNHEHGDEGGCDSQNPSAPFDVQADSHGNRTNQTAQEQQEQIRLQIHACDHASCSAEAQAEGQGDGAEAGQKLLRFHLSHLRYDIAMQPARPGPGWSRRGQGFGLAARPWRMYGRWCW